MPDTSKDSPSQDTTDKSASSTNADPPKGSEGGVATNGSSDVVINGSAEEGQSKPMTRRQKLIFSSVALSYTACLLSFSILAPFFPVEAHKKGISSTQVGLIFGVFNLVNFLFSPFFGKYLPVIGAKFMFLAGSWVAGGCNILFGFLDEIDDKQTFLIYCYVIRTVEAIGASASFTASITIVANTFPDKVAQMTGLLEMFSGAGFMLGPPLGGLLYSIGGYKLPFMVLGGIATSSICINFFLLPSIGVDEHEPGSLTKMFAIPAVYPVCFCILIGSASITFLDPTLALHLTTSFGVSPAMVGVVFLIIGGVYGATQPVWGFIADKKKSTRWMMIIGFYLACVGYLLVGPSPLLNIPKASQLWLVVFSLALIAAALGMSIMPAFLDLFMEAKWYGLPEDLATQGIVTGLFNCFFSLGAFIGPTAGGALVDIFGFDWAATVLSGCNLFAMLIISLFGIWEFQWGKGRRPPWKKFDGETINSSDEERQPLMQNSVDVERSISTPCINSVQS